MGLEQLIGSWDVEVQRGDEVVAGTAWFTRDVGDAFVVMRSRMEDPVFPEAMAVIAADGDAYTQHYFDSRGVVRIYAMTLDEREWTLSRETADFSELPFKQRFSGTFSEDGTEIDARWERTDDAGEWMLDFRGTYRRV